MSTTPPIANLNQLIEKYDQMKKQDKADLSSDQDLTFAIMNLVSIEEHLIFTGAKTQKNNYYDLVEEVRKIRRALMQTLFPTEPEGEVWCITKHLLATSMRLMEVGSKQLSLNKKTEGYEFFQKAYDIYCLFWGIQMKAISTESLKNIDENALDKQDKTKTGVFTKLGELVRKAINCCIE